MALVLGNFLQEKERDDFNKAAKGRVIARILSDLRQVQQDPVPNVEVIPVSTFQYVKN